ncbi:BMP family lipoprotein [Leptolyngbya ohadii]|uniref:BMP family lipoprotein n=1 Tax=Leptolyngbya ohadii TaxID=1962290 RepID=UPI000B59D752|nr:BMP family ABC transporter substrate-binding protein [Leptolyngbya ohadii]
MHNRILRRQFIRFLVSLTAVTVTATACGSQSGTETGSSTSGGQATSQQKVGVVLGTGGENDKSFNEYTLKGAREGAQAAGLEFSYVSPSSNSDFEKNIETQISEGANLIVSVGFQMGDATAAMAKKYPDVKFVIIDYAYDAKDGVDPYQGDLKNVTSLLFAEDQAGYLAGVLAACVSETGKIATVSGMEIPPVVRFVTGFQSGAKSVNPNIVTFNQYIPDFGDPATGKSVGQNFISQGADVVFGVGGNTGNGGLVAAKEAGKKAIGVDVDQYLSYPEVKDALITSAVKNIDVATANAVKEFAAGQLKPGIQQATIATGGVGLAPYHEWDSKISQECKAQVTQATDALKANPQLTGAK